MRRIAIGLSLILTACASTTPCVPSVSVQTVDRPVPVACIDKASVPAEPAPVTLTGDARNDDALLAAKLAAVRVWGRSLAAMIAPCTR